MDLMLFGATGATGRELLAQALEQGHRVTAFARSPERLSDLQDANLRTARGDALDPAAVEAAVPGHDAVLCALGVGDSRANLPFVTRSIIVPLFLRQAFADHQRQETVIRQSNLDWTIVRPPYLTDGPRTGDYRHGFASTDRTIKAQISRADVADFMLKPLTDNTYIRQSPGVSYSGQDTDHG